MICLSEIHLHSSNVDGDPRLNLKDFTFIRADNSHNCKRGGVGIHFKEHLAVHPVSPLNLNECVVKEIDIRDLKEYVISLYRSPSQSKDEFDHFLPNFEQLTSGRMSQSPLFVLVTGGVTFDRLLGGKLILLPRPMA